MKHPSSNFLRGCFTPLLHNLLTALIPHMEVKEILSVAIDKHRNGLVAQCWNADLAKDYYLQAP
jgi:hypothetical protein